MVKLRLRRMGAIDKPFYRIVAVDSHKKRDGKYLEQLGYYDPKTDPFTLKVDIEKSLKWLKVGAQPSETVRSLFSKAGILEKWHNMRFPTKEGKPEKEEKPEKKEKSKKTKEVKEVKEVKEEVEKESKEKKSDISKKETKPKVTKKTVKKKPEKAEKAEKAEETVKED